MKPQDFDELVESIRQAGKIKRGQMAASQQSLDADAVDARIALDRKKRPEGWHSLEDLEEGRDLDELEVEPPSRP